MNASAWELARAVRGPILLIAFGGLTALHHMNVISFERTWPTIIIVYGFLKLIERLVARPVPPQSGYTPVGYPPAQYPPPNQYPPNQYPPQTQGGAQ